MWTVFVPLFLSLMFQDSFQVLASTDFKSNISNRLVHPKTFGGTLLLRDALIFNTSIHEPLLNVSGSVLNHTTGILSTRIIPSVYVLVITLGIPSNLFVLACLSGKKNLTGGILYFSLAVSDLLQLLSLTLRIHYHFNNNNWIFGELACKLVTAGFYGNIYCSIHAHMCISVMRYLAVVHPFLFRGLSKKHTALWASLTVWVVFGITMAPEFWLQQSYQILGQNITTCHDVQPYMDQSHPALIPYRLTLICLGFFLPTLIIILVYGSIIHHLNRSSRDWAHYIRASTLVFGIFLVCFTPSSLLHLIHYVSLYHQQQDHFYPYFRAAVCLCSLHSCLDPFLSYLLTKTSTSQTKFRSFTTHPLKGLFII